MEENDDLSEEDIFIMKKMFDLILTFNRHFSSYIKENDKELFNRAVDYAKTFTQEDVPGIILSYTDEDENENSSS